MAILSMLSGYKTYIVSGLGVAAALYGWVSGTMDPMTAMTFALNAVGIGTVRAGVKKAEKAAQ